MRQPRAALCAALVSGIARADSRAAPARAEAPEGAPDRSDRAIAASARLTAEALLRIAIVV